MWLCRSCDFANGNFVISYFNIQLLLYHSKTLLMVVYGRQGRNFSHMWSACLLKRRKACIVLFLLEYMCIQNTVAWLHVSVAIMMITSGLHFTRSSFPCQNFNVTIVHFQWILWIDRSTFTFSLKYARKSYINFNQVSHIGTYFQAINQSFLCFPYDQAGSIKAPSLNVH